MKKLIISPHIDDEVMGCFSFFDKDTHIIECGVDEFHIVSRDERIRELSRVQDLYGFSFTTLANPVNHYQVPDLIELLTLEINAHRPDRVFLPYPTYNQDHRAVYNAMMVVLRPHDINHFVKQVFVYEGPDVPIWDNAQNIDGAFKPNYFREIDIDKKIEAYRLLKSQVRAFRSPEVIRQVAFIRGKNVNVPYAEAFKILRWIE
jgi:N-acetylglucosamine malate deacetylase 1